MEAILRWGVDVVLWMQQASPSLDGLFKVLTFLGSEQFYLLLLPLVYWSIDRVVGVRLIMLLLFSALVNTTVKVIAAQPRPFTYDTRVKAITTETTYGFPSGHTQNTTAVWGLIGLRVRRWWFWGFACLLLIGVGVSRVYLGVHFPTDVLGGFVIGAVVLWLFRRFGSRVGRRFTNLGFRVQLAITGFGPLVVLLLRHTDPVATGVGTMLGVGVGLVMERRWVRFETDGTVGRRAARFAVGGLVIVALWAGLRSAFTGVEPALVLRLVRYALVGLWATLGAPWLFVRLGLAGREWD